MLNGKEREEMSGGRILVAIDKERFVTEGDKCGR